MQRYSAELFIEILSRYKVFDELVSRYCPFYVTGSPFALSGLEKLDFLYENLIFYRRVFVSKHQPVFCALQ